MGIRTKILYKGKILQEQLIRLLIKFDKRISALEEGDGGSDNTELISRLESLEERVTALEPEPQDEQQGANGGD